MSTTENETTASIQTVIEETLRNNGYSTYITYARPVVTALTEREYAISEKLLAIAESMEADEDEIREALKGVGLAVKDPEPEPVEDEETDDTSRIASALERIESRLDSLTQFARSNGYRG